MSQQPDQADLFALFNEIGIVNQLATTRFERALPDGLTPSQFSVLNNFVRLGGTRSPKQLADAFQVTKGAMTNTLDKLLAKGCVTIKPDPHDGRAKVVALTKKGAALRAKAVAAASPAFSDVGALLSARDVQLLLPRLRKLRQHLDESR